MRVKVIGPNDEVLAELVRGYVPRRGEFVVIRDKGRYRVVEVEWNMTPEYNQSATVWVEAIE